MGRLLLACALLLLSRCQRCAGGSAAAAEVCGLAVAPVALAVDSKHASHVSYPTGDKSFSVLESFPGHGPLAAENISPFLLSHEWGTATKRIDGRVAPDPGPPSARSKAKLVGWHPHRGFDLVTYVKEGRGCHADSLGNVAVVRPGGVQWMRSGSGIEHAEGGGNPPEASKHGFQLWINLPASMKMDKPAYGTVQPEDVPELRDPAGGTSRFIAGNFSNALGDRSDMMIVDCELPDGVAAHSLLIPPALTGVVLAYAYQGSGTVAGTRLKPGETVVLRGGAAASAAGADGLIVMSSYGTAGQEGFGVMVFAGLPIEGEEIAWRGPIVMNSDAEIDAAYAELRRGGGFYREKARGNYQLAADSSNVPYTTPKVDVGHLGLAAG